MASIIYYLYFSISTITTCPLADHHFFCGPWLSFDFIFLDYAQTLFSCLLSKSFPIFNTYLHFFP